MKFNLWINSDSGNVKLFELNRGLGMYPAGIHPMKDDYIGVVELGVEKPNKKIAFREIREKFLLDKDSDYNLIGYCVPKNAKNVRCVFDIEE